MRIKNLLLLFALIAFTGTVNAKVFRLFYLGGQSNMDGYGFVNELPAELNGVSENIYIYHVQPTNDGEKANGKGIWVKLQPGHGMDFQFKNGNNIYGKRFGVELSFAKRMQELLPGENIAIVKYSKGGTSIDISAAGQFGCWNPDYSDKNGVNQYDHFLATILGAYSVDDIDGDGEADQLIPAGILWMQGESDANSAEVAMKYEHNLKRLMDLIRASLLQDDLPVVIGRISDSKNDADGLVWDFGNVVRAAQQRFVEKDPAAAMVISTDNYKYSDKWHYDTSGFIDLGVQFAEEMAKLVKRK